MTKDFFSCKMEYKKDAHGQEILLKDGKFQVMMEWEKPYMQACIDALKPFGDVLEIGFGLGYSAEQIQHYHPKSHTIIEYHPEVAARAREWAQRYPHVTIIEDTWQNALPKLGMYDCIFFDDYPLQSERQMQKMTHESKESDLLLQKGKKLLEQVEKELPFLHQIQYSDQDLIDLMTQIPLHEPSSVQQFVRFMQELVGRGQISHKQLKEMLDHLVKDGKWTAQQTQALFKQPESQSPFSFSGPNDRLFIFLSECLKDHMRKGSRFSCFLSSPVSKFEDEKFFNEIIVNPYLDFHEEEIVLDIPEHCDYFSGNKALVITIVKMA
jgi:hypothetical protein